MIFKNGKISRWFRFQDNLCQSARYLPHAIHSACFNIVHKPVKFRTVKLSFLRPYILSKSAKWPFNELFQYVDFQRILSSVTHISIERRTYSPVFKTFSCVTFLCAIETLLLSCMIHRLLKRNTHQRSPICWRFLKRIALHIP